MRSLPQGAGAIDRATCPLPCKNWSTARIRAGGVRSMGCCRNHPLVGHGRLFDYHAAIGRAGLRGKADAMVHAQGADLRRATAALAVGATYLLLRSGMWH